MNRVTTSTNILFISSLYLFYSSFPVVCLFSLCVCLLFPLIRFFSLLLLLSLNLFLLCPTSSLGVTQRKRSDNNDTTQYQTNQHNKHNSTHKHTDNVRHKGNDNRQSEQGTNDERRRRASSGLKFEALWNLRQSEKRIHRMGVVVSPMCPPIPSLPRWSLSLSFVPLLASFRRSAFSSLPPVSVCRHVAVGFFSSNSITAAVTGTTTDDNHAHTRKEDNTLTFASALSASSPLLPSVSRFLSLNRSTFLLPP